MDFAVCEYPDFEAVGEVFRSTTLRINRPQHLECVALRVMSWSECRQIVCCHRAFRIRARLDESA